jgi:hypothetical protein
MTEHDTDAVVGRVAFAVGLWEDEVAAALSHLKPGDRLSGVDENGKPITLVVVPEEPTKAMLAAALPLSTSQPLSIADKKLGAAACLLLSGGCDIPTEGDAVLAGAQLAADYRAMLAAAGGQS